jgi:acetyltransferase
MAKPQHAPSDEVHDIFRRVRSNPLNRIFAPKSIAVVGATDKENSVGHAVMANLASFTGQVFPVNPHHSTVLGKSSFKSVRDLPGPVDLAIIATPAQTVPGVVRECVEAGVGGAVILSAGFKEAGEEGHQLEEQVLAEAQRGPMRIIGPNCLGLMAPHTGLNATFAGSLARPGRIAFLSQSGALCSAILDWSHRENVGFSAFVSVGSMLDVGWGDLIDWLGDDPLTKSIIVYMESVGDAHAFLSAAREVALTKPIIVIKVGRTEAASRAASSHTGALTGSDEVLEAAFRRAGVLRVATISELFDMAEALAKQPRPPGPNLAIVTNAGGPGALATDALVSSGGSLAPLSEQTLATLNGVLPSHWSHGNPVDVLGDASPERFSKAIQAVSADPGCDGVLVVMTPQAMSDAKGVASALVAAQRSSTKPFLASFMGGAAVDETKQTLNEAGIPTYDFPDTAARAFALMWQHTRNVNALYETPAFLAEADDAGVRRADASRVIYRARNSGSARLSKVACGDLLSSYGISVPPVLLACDENEAAQCAKRLGYPVVLKLHSDTITHKTDVGGVKLNLQDEDAIRRAWRDIRAGAGDEHFRGVTVEPMIDTADGWELILGCTDDPQFGPVLLFGAGGTMVEVLNDHALGLPPLTATLARRMVERTRIYKALKGVRGRPPVDLDKLDELLVRFSRLIVESPRVKEMEINPLLASPRGFMALDVRASLHDCHLKDEELPRAAIRPYPGQYVYSYSMRDGSTVVLRPIRPDDEPLMVQFHKTLSEESVYNRYFSAMRLDQRVAHSRLSRICFIDYSREMALVVERATGELREIIAVGRLTKMHGVNEAEFAIVVSDAWQHQGLGTELLRQLVSIGRDEKLACITAEILPNNHAMQALAKKVGFRIHWDLASLECHAEVML